MHAFLVTTRDRIGIYSASATEWKRDI